MPISVFSRPLKTAMRVSPSGSPTGPLIVAFSELQNTRNLLYATAEPLGEELLLAIESSRDPLRDGHSLKTRTGTRILTDEIG